MGSTPLLSRWRLIPIYDTRAHSGCFTGNLGDILIYT